MIRRFQILAVALIVALSVASSTNAAATTATGMCVDLIAVLEHTQDTANLCGSGSARCTYYCDDDGGLDTYKCECL